MLLWLRRIRKLVDDACATRNGTVKFDGQESLAVSNAAHPARVHAGASVDGTGYYAHGFLNHAPLEVPHQLDEAVREPRNPALLDGVRLASC
jgi:hypothetical protein